jgi:two-component system sensor histidine kinase AgrC
MQITPHRTYAPFELFLLLGPMLVGLLFFFRNARVLRGVEQQRRAYLDKDAELAVQRFYNQQVQPIVENLRRQRHGHENSLAVLAGLARARDLDGIERFLSQSSEDPVHLAPIDESALHRVRSAALLGLLSAKTAEARSRDVRFEFSALTEVSDLPIPVFTLCEILGILLDNALEAAESASCPFVRFEILSKESSLVFRISNTFATAPDLDRLGDKGYTTKSDGHGLGLHIVRARLRRLPGVQLNATLEIPWFSQELLVPDAVPESSRNGVGI